jgi:hypothetical protein
MGSDIFKITEKYDDMVLEYLKLHKETKYFFLSSGAVYGGNYQKPVDENTVATIDINNLKSTDWYTLAKLHAEAKHRALLINNNIIFLIVTKIIIRLHLIFPIQVCTTRPLF